jgi:AcrR family transcriptional regulator
VFQQSNLSGVPRNGTVPAPTTSTRRDELLELAYQHALEHGLSGMSLRPLATAIGSSPRVLLFLFGSKDGLVRALLVRARADELAFLGLMPAAQAGDLAAIGAEVWRWLSAVEHIGLLRLWTESYARSLIEPDGPWTGFARETVEDWLELLARSQPARRRRTGAGRAERTLVLAVLRGALLDLLGTGDLERTTQAVELGLASLGARGGAALRSQAPAAPAIAPRAKLGAC